jgi:hypothetical protein
VKTAPAVTNDVSLTDLSMKAAADLADLLNRIDHEAAKEKPAG